MRTELGVGQSRRATPIVDCALWKCGVFGNVSGLGVCLEHRYLLWNAYGSRGLKVSPCPML